MKKSYITPIIDIEEIEESLDLLAGSPPPDTPSSENDVIDNGGGDENDADDDSKSKGNTIFLTYDSEW